MATNYPSGIRSKGVPLPAGDDLLTTGDVFHVDSGHTNTSDGNAGTHPSYPKATIDSAIDATTASNGDIIMVSPGHTETISGATSLVPDVAGVKIIGIGHGADRPTLTFSAAGSNIPISAASVVMKNFLITNTGTIDVTAGITITASDCLIENVEFRESATTSQFIEGVLVSNAAADRTHIRGFKFIGLAGDAGNAAISTTAATDDCVIEDFHIVGTFAEGGIDNVDAAAVRLVIQRGLIDQSHSTQDECISVHASSTGFINEVRLRTETNDANGFNVAITATHDMQVYDALVVNLDTERGADWGTASTA
tara:strand:+ start:6475 stop:7404 length:930 start_codon:yes stop_codon:yes gene_type:complete